MKRRCTIRSREGLWAGALITLAVAGCGGEHRLPADAGPVPSSRPVASASASASASAYAPAPAVSASAAAPVETTIVEADASAAPAAALPAGEPELSRFQVALQELARGGRKAHVRILWLGDSHGQADFWTGAMRDVLQKRFGKAGPGFVHVGWKQYRHDGVRLSTDEKWSIRPKAPATSSRTGDGVFGLGGLVTTGPAGSGKARVNVTDEGLHSRLSWDVCYRLRSPDDELEVSLGTGPKQKIRATATEPPGALRHLTLVSEGRETLHVTPTRGNPELCGVVIETDPAERAGVVLDTLGINGARFGTPLAWDEASFGAELARRKPSLVVLEYGTNEAGDVAVDPAKYTQKLVRLVERIRRFAPDTDCLALAPTDRADARVRTPLVRDAIRDGARQAGCSFWDTYAVMGGEGSIKAWASESPARAANDGVHLTQRGYRELGEALASHVLRGLPP
ncbi:GDSL-type esterase/lipase family protein [Polyangium sp. 6x1]|uniref:GDSL-type esterase/lipase family protein n=1 Tax=Polyangium sp. 6x1 TaxID=3042689 RepID=UPI0024830039|nr:GDSL-type esterase/lipase family protein [Polyangium sp. 6x1]MDI1446447.1 GDSL-type esterase/lipase family protein [Polyangium sp. 6x1]